MSLKGESVIGICFFYNFCLDAILERITVFSQSKKGLYLLISMNYV